LNVAAGRRAIRPGDGADELFQREPARAKSRWIGEHVVLLLVASEAHDVGYAGDAHQVFFDDPVLPAAELARAVVIAVERVLVDLTHRRIVRAERRHDALGYLGAG